jgi:Gas vesicle synthesis protein GvpL/GvpF
MSTHRLIGVVRPDQAAKMLATNQTVMAANVVAVESLGLTALLLPDRKPLVAWLQSRKSQMGALLTFEKLLEAISADSAVLPAACGSARIAPEQALALLTTHAAALTEALETYGALVQFQIQVRWDAVKAMAYLKNEGRLEGLDLSLANRDRKAFGLSLQLLMETERKRIGDNLYATLGRASRDSVRLPLDNETMVLNAAALITRDGEATLDHAVEAIDATIPDVFSIRYIGPLPAVSFANISITEPETGALAKAHVKLGTHHHASVEDIKTAYRHAIRQVHPDTGGLKASADAAADLAKASKLAMQAASAPRTAAGTPLLLDIRREGEGVHTGQARQAA